jgi:hypothetical protein
MMKRTVSRPRRAEGGAPIFLIHDNEIGSTAGRDDVPAAGFDVRRSVRYGSGRNHVGRR